MAGRRQPRRALHVIALPDANGRQGMIEGLTAGMTMRRRVMAPHFDFRLAAVRASHVIWEGSLQVRRRHYAKFNRHARDDV
jgi:hypothetical protein